MMLSSMIFLYTEIKREFFKLIIGNTSIYILLYPSKLFSINLTKMNKCIRNHYKGISPNYDYQNR